VEIHDLSKIFGTSSKHAKLPDRQLFSGFSAAAGNKTRASAVSYTTNHEFPVFVNLFLPFVVLLHQTTVNQVTRPGGPHERRTKAMLSRRWSTNEQLTCTGCFAYEPANTAPVRTLRL